MAKQSKTKQSKTKIVVSGTIAKLKQVAVLERGSILDQKKCPMCTDEHLSGRNCPFHTLHGIARHFSEHGQFLNEGGILYADFVKKPDEENYQRIIIFLGKLVRIENKCNINDLMLAFEKFVEDKMRKGGSMNLEEAGREKGYSAMFEFLRGNYYAFLLMEQDAQQMISLFEAFVERRKVSEEEAYGAVYPVEYNKGLNAALEEGKKKFKELVGQYYCT